jgi:hypothetical protein
MTLSIALNILLAVMVLYLVLVVRALDTLRGVLVVTLAQ